ncbi:hypothetical protein K2X33_04750 [bacterium]|nr:hypothetical protein [bacterium]
MAGRRQVFTAGILSLCLAASAEAAESGLLDKRPDVAGGLRRSFESQPERAQSVPSLAPHLRAPRGLPVPLPPVQLAVLQRLASLYTHQEIARDLGLELKQVHDTIGNLEHKMGEIVGDSSLRRTELSFFPDWKKPTRILILWERGLRKWVFLGEGVLPMTPLELSVLSLWIDGHSLKDIAELLSTPYAQVLGIWLSLSSERRHDFGELFSWRRYQFKREVEVTATATDVPYLIYRAFGVDREAIASSRGVSVGHVGTMRDRLLVRLKNAVGVREDELDWRHLHFSMAGLSKGEFRIVAKDFKGGLTLFTVRYEPAKPRLMRCKNVVIKLGVIQELLESFPGQLGNVMRLVVVQGLSVKDVAAKLKIRVDTVRKYTSAGTARLGVALGEPELNLYNLKFK